MAAMSGEGASGQSAASFRAPVIVLAALSLTAGFADGYSLTHANVFVANQSGNVVRVGMGAVGAFDAWPLALCSIVGFAVGGLIAWTLTRSAARTQVTLVRVRLLTVMALIVLWWLGMLLISGQGTDVVAALLGAAAMGVLASVMTRVAGVPVQTTFQSATVLRSAEGAAEWATHADPQHRTGRTLALLSLITLTAYAGGGALGALAERTLTTGSVAVLMMPVLLGIALVLVHRPAAP